MVRQVSDLWRTCRTGLGFGVFGLGALVVALGVFPLIRWLPGDHERRAQWLVHLTFRSWIWVATGLGLLRVRWQGTERLRAQRPCVVVANHPTLIDVILLIACLPQADCVVKSSAWRNPFLRWVVAGAGYIRNDGDALVDTCAARVRRGRWLVLFPEGTRSSARRLAPFHRGAAHVALRSGAPLLPVVITCNPPTLMKGQQWHHVPERTVQFTVQVCEPIWPVEASNTVVSEALAARRLTAEVRRFYEQRLRYVDA